MCKTNWLLFGIVLSFLVLTGCHRKNELATRNGLTEERVIEIAREHGVDAWFEPPSKDSRDTREEYVFKSEEEVHQYFAEVARLNQSIKDSNEHNRQRVIELNNELARCQTHKDTLRVYLAFPDVVTMDESGIQECIDLGLLTKHDRRN
ncbi:MAG: hypothetical protein H6555_10815 [Lewinellaceae bacterium]|nr:hypothetical protein [Lewinellaceae bacterium]